MRLQKRNLTSFEYYAYEGEEEELVDGMHTGNLQPKYSEYPIEYQGNLSAPSSFVTNQLFGINTNYTHILLMENRPETQIDEEGLIIINGIRYSVRAVRPTLNVLAIALRKQTENHMEEG